jgi:hypothetical protein
MALRMMTSLRATATSAAIFGFPAAHVRLSGSDETLVKGVADRVAAGSDHGTREDGGASGWTGRGRCAPCPATLAAITLQ